MIQVSRENQCYFITFVTHNRLPVFRTDKIAQICCNALDEARKSGKFSIYAYSIMPNHIHILTNGKIESAEVLRYLKGVTARRVIDFLKKNNHFSSLKKLQLETKARNYKYSLWQHHSNTYFVSDDSILMQKINYIHQNPVKDNLVENAEDYLYSSFRIWKGKPIENEPLLIDL